MINEILYKKLVEVASQGKTIPYGEAMALVDLKPGNYVANEIGKKLGEISEREYKNGRPLLIVVVMTGKKPGNGFFKLASSLDKNLNLQTAEAEDEFFQAELSKVHKYWQGKWEGFADSKYWLENYWPIESERTSLTVWFHKKKKFGRKEMKAGDCVIFYETRKNPDGYKGGAKTIFALGVLTDKFLPIPEGQENRGGKEWEIRQVVTPVILIQPKDGVPLKEIEKRLPQCRGWVRQGTLLSKENFEILESMLKEKAAGLEQEAIKKVCALRKIGFEANRRLLDVQKISHDCSIGEDTVAKVNCPVKVHGQRASALRFFNRRVQALFHALTVFRLLPNGFSNHDLRQHVVSLLGESAVSTAGKMTYDLRRLRLHGLIEKIPKTHRYHVTSFGLRTALFFSKTHSRLLRPGLSLALSETYDIPQPIRDRFDALESSLNQFFQQTMMTN